MKSYKKKICLNCRKDWDECHGHKCLCLEGACCDLPEEENKKKMLNMEHLAFGYVLSED